MIKIQGLTLEDFVTIVEAGTSKDITQSPVKFVHSVVGRLCLQELKFHSCDNEECSTLVLSTAESLATKRPVNPQGLRLLHIRFRNGAIASEKIKELETELGYSEYFTLWIRSFYEAMIQVLHNEVKAEELFGEGPLLELWKEYYSFVGNEA